MMLLKRWISIPPRIEKYLESITAEKSHKFVKVLETYEQLKRARNSENYLNSLIEKEIDKDMNELYEEERQVCISQQESLYDDILNGLIPKDENDINSAMVEIRAGTGGHEAGLFAAELWEMYKKYSESNGWEFSCLSFSEFEGEGLREGIAYVKGFGAYARLKYESGVHRVQRVPKTENSGRIHTSTVSLAVLPEQKQAAIELLEKDLKWEAFRAQGPGGQHVNTTNSAVRVTHLPSGISVSMQEERSQHLNKARALNVLQYRLTKLQQDSLDKERQQSRSKMIGGASRSEKVRTFNFPQDRITDHRINFSCHNIEKFLDGQSLDKLIEALEEKEKEEFLNTIGN